MKRGLHIKLVLIMLVLIISLMTVVCAFLVRGVMDFFMKEFYKQMSQVFSSAEFYSDLVAAAEAPEGEKEIERMLQAYYGLLGIDTGSRNYYILNGKTGEPLVGPETNGAFEMTPNIITALTGKEGYRGDVGASYMDVALPIRGGDNVFIIYIRDNKSTVQALNMELFTIIMEALVIGLVISLLLSFLLSKTMIIPVQSLTRAANKVAAGDFSEKIEVMAKDEIGVLTRTFNNMAQRLESTLKDIESERNKLSTVFLHMTDGIVAFSRSGEVIHHNPSAEQMLARRFIPEPPGFDELFGPAVTSDEVFALVPPDVMEIERNTGGKSLEISFAPFLGEEGGVMAVIHDVTQAKRSEEMRREFVANVSHELRTPITSVRSYAETLVSSDELDANTRKHFLGVIMNESDRMTKIVQDLLALSKYDAGEIDMRFEAFSLTNSVQNIYDAMILDVNKRGLKMTLLLENNVPDIIGDKDRIEQVIINIVSNAVRYTPEGGEITVGAGMENGMAWVAVKDTGIGIPKEDIPRLFDRFYRVDKARSRAFGGTGLGLSIAHEIVTKHGGTIEVDSEPDVGTIVTVKLPSEQRMEDA